MTFAFDTLGYAKHLHGAGVPINQAEAHAEAARQFVMAELVTKTDLAQAIDTQTLRLTVRLGSLMIVGLGALGAVLKLLP